MAEEVKFKIQVEEKERQRLQECSDQSQRKDSLFSTNFFSLKK